MEENKRWRLALIIVALTCVFYWVNVQSAEYNREMFGDDIEETRSPLFSLLFSLFEAVVLVILFYYCKGMFDEYQQQKAKAIPMDLVSGYFNEEILEFSIQSVSLVEPRTTRQSIGVGAGKSGIGVGTSKSFYAGEEQTKVDRGELTFGPKSIQFMGSTKQISWEWKKIIDVSVSHHLLASSIFIAVSSRKNISGISLNAEKEAVAELASNILEKSKND